jgi:hypothetical protein
MTGAAASVVKRVERVTLSTPVSARAAKNCSSPGPSNGALAGSCTVKRVPPELTPVFAAGSGCRTVSRNALDEAVADEAHGPRGQIIAQVPGR